MTLPAPDQIALAVGRVAMEAGRLELIGTALHMALLNSDVAYLVAWGQSWSSTKDACEKLAEHRLTEATVAGNVPQLVEALAAVRPAMRDIEQLMGQRANVVHGHWIAHAPGQVADTAQLLKRRGRVDSRPWTLEQLEDLRVNLNRAGNRINDITHTVLTVIADVRRA